LVFIPQRPSARDFPFVHPAVPVDIPDVLAYHKVYRLGGDMIEGLFVRWMERLGCFWYVFHDTNVQCKAVLPMLSARGLAMRFVRPSAIREAVAFIWVFG
jgi:hypothetical protein